VRTAEFGGAAIHGNVSQLAFDRKPKFEIYFRRRFGPGEFNLPHDRAGFRLRLQCEADPAPSRGGLLDADLLSGHHPLAWNALGQEILAAYALTEPLAGSDALAIRTRADLSPDGKYYVLNGQKIWITNGGAADLFTVFAKVGGELFTAFLVERSFPGVSSGAEEHKMGMKGSSTTAVYFDNVQVPVENVLGEVGRGHIIAFNILNLGRLKLGPGALGAAKNVLAVSLKYAKERKAFGSAIAEFGAIQHKLAEMAIRIYVVESMVWRVVGLIESQLRAAPQDKSDASRTELKAGEE